MAKQGSNKDERRRKQRRRADARMQPTAQSDSLLERLVHEMRLVIRGEGVVSSRVVHWSPATPERRFADLTLRVDFLGLFSTVKARLSLFAPEDPNDSADEVERNCLIVASKFMQHVVHDCETAARLVLARAATALEDIGLYSNKVTQEIARRLGLPDSYNDHDGDILVHLEELLPEETRRVWYSYALDGYLLEFLEEVISRSSEGTFDDLQDKLDSVMRKKLEAAARAL